MAKLDQNMTLSSLYLYMQHISTTNLKDNRIRPTQTTNTTKKGHTRPIQRIEHMDNTLKRSHSMQQSHQKRKLNQKIRARKTNSTTCLCSIWSQSKQLRLRILQIARKSTKIRLNLTNQNNMITKTSKSHLVESMSSNKNHNQLLKPKVLKRERENKNTRNRLNFRIILKKRRRKRKLLTLIQIRPKTINRHLGHEI